MTPFAIHLHLDGIVSELVAINRRLNDVVKLVKEGVETMALNFDTLEAKVAQFETVEQSTEALLSALSTEIKNLSGQITTDPAMQAKLDDFANRLDAKTTALSAALVAHTPAAPPVTPPTP